MNRYGIRTFRFFNAKNLHTPIRRIDGILKKNVLKLLRTLGDKIIHSGITNDLHRREKELQRDYGKDVHQIGKRTTQEAARDWEKKQRRRTA